MLHPLLPMLAYGDLTAEDWSKLGPANCIQFIQLAQCALDYLLALAAGAQQQQARQHVKILGAKCSFAEGCCMLETATATIAAA